MAGAVSECGGGATRLFVTCHAYVVTLNGAQASAPWCTFPGQYSPPAVGFYAARSLPLPQSEQIDARRWFFASMYAERESPKDDNAAAFGNHLRGGRFGGEWHTMPDQVLFANVSFERRNFRSIACFSSSDATANIQHHDAEREWRCMRVR